MYVCVCVCMRACASACCKQLASISLSHLKVSLVIRCVIPASVA